jgi:hypothetical protein
MRLTEQRLRILIREEVERRLFNKLIDVLITEELKRFGINEEDKDFDDWKAVSRRKFLQNLGRTGAAATALGLGGAYLDRKLRARGAARQASKSAYKKASKEAKEALGEYSGPHFSRAEQEEYFSSFDFAGSIQDLNSYSEDSIESTISQFRPSGLPTTFISAAALSDKPIPKLKANSGDAALLSYNIKYEAAQDKPRALYRLYTVWAGIGQVGYAGAGSVTLVVNAGGKKVRVPPPEWSILFHFIVEKAKKLSEEELIAFQNNIFGSELDRFFNTVHRGKQEALDKGYEMGSKAKQHNDQGRPPITTPDQYRKIKPDDLVAEHGQSFFDIGFVAAVNGKEKPKVATRN